MDAEHPDTTQLNTERLSEPRVVSNQMHPARTLTELEQVIDRVGTRYIDDLRLLSEAFHQFYATQLAERDEQIAVLSQRVAATERERNELATQLHELRQTSARYIANLRALSEELSRQMDRPDGGVGD